MLTSPPANLSGWVANLQSADIPILRRTALRLDALRPVTEDIDFRQIAEVVYQDPLMTLKVLAHLSTHKGKRQLTDVETVEQAIAMMGVAPFFRHFSAMTTVEQQLCEQRNAHLGLMRVITRAYRAAEFAKDWAMRRQDLDYEVIVVAALLHDFAEMLVWCFAPELALRMRELQRAHPSQRSAALQRRVLGVTLNNLELALMQQWQLPTLLIKMSDDTQAQHPQVRNVQYAVNLARHCANGWSDPALPDDFRAVAQLLNTTPELVRELVHPAALTRE